MLVVILSLIIGLQTALGQTYSLRNFKAIDGLPKTDQVLLPYGFSRQAYLVMKEAMTNAFANAQARNVSFSLRGVKDGFELELEDDGLGFLVHETTAPHGLSNMRLRTSWIQSTSRIESKLNGGTVVRLKFPDFKTQEYGKRK